MADDATGKPKEHGCLYWGLFSCGGCLFIGGGAVAIFLGFIFLMLRSNDAYREAKRRATTDQRVITVLGSPVRSSLLVSGSINTKGSTGDADLRFSISGPKGKAAVHAVATREQDTWTFQTLVVHPARGPDIDLLH